MIQVNKMIILNNLTAMAAQRQYNLILEKNKKTTQKLASGYQVNKAADNAVSLAISEKMRSQIRGLDRGTLNTEDGISWIMTGEGALTEVSALMHS